MLKQLIMAGAGQAAAQAIECLRRRGYDGSIVLIGDEPHEPYHRPPLSKKYLAGGLMRERLSLRSSSFYTEHRVELLLGQRLSRIDRQTHRVALSCGTHIAYDKLLLATGSEPRRVSLPGIELAGVHVLRTVGDTDALRESLRPGCRLVIVGGGYVGLEVAATARALGLEVTVLEMAPRLMSRVVCESISAFYAAEHARHGVRVQCDVSVRMLRGDQAGRVRAVLCEDGRELPADTVLIAAGAAPLDGLAAAAGLVCANGVVIDEHCCTSDPDIYAAGDCANQSSVRYGRRVRLESVDNAVEMGTSAALNLLGIDTVHDKVPWFWSDQYDLKLVIVGLAQGHDQVVLRGDVESRRFSACYLKAGELLAVDTVNNPKDHMAARRLIAARVQVDPARLGDGSLTLQECVVSRERASGSVS